MNGRGPKSSHLRLVVARVEARGSTEPIAEDARHAWPARAARHARAFVARQGHHLSDPSLVAWVLEQCAELVLEAPHAPCWSALPVEELWRRLDNLQRFFPQPRLIVAHHETLCAFLPWLCTEGLLDPVRAEAMLARLEQVSAHALTRALAELAARRARRGGPQPGPR